MSLHFFRTMISSRFTIIAHVFSPAIGNFLVLRAGPAKVLLMLPQREIGNVPLITNLVITFSQHVYNASANNDRKKYQSDHTIIMYVSLEK